MGTKQLQPITLSHLFAAEKRCDLLDQGMPIPQLHDLFPAAENTYFNSYKIVPNNFMAHGTIGAPDIRRSQVRPQGRTWWLSDTISKMGNLSWLVIGIVSIESCWELWSDAKYVMWAGWALQCNPVTL